MNDSKRRIEKLDNILLVARLIVILLVLPFLLGLSANIESICISVGLFVLGLTVCTSVLIVLDYKIHDMQSKLR